MHTEIRYTGTENQKQRKALKDTIEWMNSWRYRSVIRDMRKCARYEGIKPEAVRLMFGIGGVSGYPVEAIWHRYIAPVNKERYEW